jgi:ubiquinone/menaquinone biosynthesis C-methylase UbiE
MSEVIVSPEDLAVSGSPSEMVLTYMAVQPDRLKGRLVLDVASGTSDVTHRLNSVGAIAFGVDPVYRDEARMQREYELFRSEHKARRARRAMLGSEQKGITFKGKFAEPVDPLEAAYDRFWEDYKLNPYRYVVGSAEALPFQDGMADLVLNNMFLSSLDPNEAYTNAVINEMVRVLRMGGEARIGAFSGPNSTVPADIVRTMAESKALIKDVASELARAKQIRKVSERSHPIGSIVVISK